MTALPAQTCLIEAERDVRRTQLSYSDFKELALPLARALEDAILMPAAAQRL